MGEHTGRTPKAGGMIHGVFEDEYGENPAASDESRGIGPASVRAGLGDYHAED